MLIVHLTRPSARQIAELRLPPERMRFGERLVGAATRLLRRSGAGTARPVVSWLPWPGSRWTQARDLPVPPVESFRAWWRRVGRDEGSS